MNWVLVSSTSGLNLLFHPYLPLWILLPMHSELLLVWQTYLGLLASAPFCFPPKMPLSCHVFKIISILWGPIQTALPPWSSSIFFSAGVSLSIIFLPTVVYLSWPSESDSFQPCILLCCIYVSSRCFKFSEKEDCVSHVIGFSYSTKCPEYCREISQWVLEVIFLVTHLIFFFFVFILLSITPLLFLWEGLKI